MKPDKVDAILDDTLRHIAEMEVLRVKEALWRVSLWIIRETTGPIDMRVFEAAIAILTEQTKESLKANPGYAATIQDGIAEVRSEAKRMFCLPKEPPRQMRLDNEADSAIMDHMTSRDFCFWLQGFFEIRAGGECATELTPSQVQIVRNHLNLVFKHEIDPSIDKGDATTKSLLDAIHEAKTRPSFDGDEGGLIRC